MRHLHRLYAVVGLRAATDLAFFLAVSVVAYGDGGPGAVGLLAAARVLRARSAWRGATALGSLAAPLPARLLGLPGALLLTGVLAAVAVLVGVEGRGVRRLRSDDAFGEVALIRHVPRTTTVVATSPSVLLTLDREAFVTTVTGHRPTDAWAEGVVAEVLAEDARRAQLASEASFSWTCFSEGFV